MTAHLALHPGRLLPGQNCCTRYLIARRCVGLTGQGEAFCHGDLLGLFLLSGTGDPDLPIEAAVTNPVRTFTRPSIPAYFAIILTINAPAGCCALVTNISTCKSEVLTRYDGNEGRTNFPARHLAQRATGPCTDIFCTTFQYFNCFHFSSFLADRRISMLVVAGPLPG